MFYNIIIFLGGLIALPKWLFQSKYKGSKRQRFGLLLPQKTEGTPRIWFHMVSMGETRAMMPIYAHLKEKYPKAAFYFSNTTKTGQEEAKRRFEGTFFILPLDLSSIMRKLTSLIQPDILILSESDFWLNQIQAVKNRGGKVLLLNGKISQKSATRFSKAPLFSQKLFNAIDHLCIQNEAYASLFKSLHIPKEKLTVTGNLKLAIPLAPLTSKELITWRNAFGLSENDQVITIGSTHEGEEELLLSQMPKDAKILLVPRHPERFAEVKKRFTTDQVRVVDQMGILSICYQLCDIALVGGSFKPGVGGHNIFEPIQAQKPVIFGPYMETQKELVSLILDAKAGIQTPAQGLPQALKKAPSLQENVETLSQIGSKTQEKSIAILDKLCENS